MKIAHLDKALCILRHIGSVAYAAIFRNNRPGKSVVPKNFDWKYYLELYPDLRELGLQSKADAIKHYTQHGFFEKRIIRLQDQSLIIKHNETRLRQLKNISLFNEQQRRLIKNDSYNRPITVSVIITLYNYAAYIDACLKSVLNSTLKDIEIIIVNDASTDNPLPQCQAFFSCGVPITIVDKLTNTGLVHSRNLGIQQAEGDYVFILDADNEIYPHCLEAHLNTMRYDSSLIACYAVIDVFDESGAFFGQNSNQPFDLIKLYNGNYIDAMAMFKRQELITAGAYDEHLLEQGSGYEDYELWLRLGQQGKSVGFIERPLSRYLKKQESLIAVALKYYHTPLMSFLRHKYFNENPCGLRTVILVVGMHRSGTSALAGLIGRMGAALGPDRIEPMPSNPRGHFEPRKIVLANDDLIEKLGATGLRELPDDWLERKETQEARARIQEIIKTDFSDQDLFVIKDPRLCLLLPLYRNLLEELGITIKVIVICREPQEVIESLNARDGTPADVARKYCEKHIKALEANLTGMESISVSFDRLIETPETVIEQITAFIPSLSNVQNHDTDQGITTFIEPALRHHNIKRKKLLASMSTAFVRLRGRFNKAARGPDFLIIGAQRAGTTTLYHYLLQHPQIQEPVTKELHWFHAGPKEGDGDHTGHKSQQWYEKKLQPRKNTLRSFLQIRKKLKFEATPEYLFHPLIAENVAHCYPATKIIVLLRDPLERAISQYYHEKKHGFIEAELSIEEYFARDNAITAKEEAKLINDCEYYSHSYEHHSPISRSNYGRQLNRWMRVFPRQQILILHSEKMFREPYPELNTISNFLGIQPFPQDLATKLTAYNNYKRKDISEEQRKILLSYFPFDMSVEKFLTPPGSA